MNQYKCISQHHVAVSNLSGMVCYMYIWSNVLLLVLPLSKSVVRMMKIRLLRTIAGCFNSCILFPNSPHLLEIVYWLVITAAVSNSHLHTIIRNMPVHYCFTIYVEITWKGTRVTYHAVWPHATTGFGAVSQRHELGAEGWFTLEGYDSVAHNYQFLCHCWDCFVCRNCWYRLIQHRQQLHLQKKIQGGVPQDLCFVCTVTSYNTWSWTSTFRKQMRSKTYDLFKNSYTNFPRS